MELYMLFPYSKVADSFYSFQKTYTEWRNAFPIAASKRSMACKLRAESKFALSNFIAKKINYKIQLHKHKYVQFYNSKKILINK